MRGVGGGEAGQHHRPYRCGDPGLAERERCSVVRDFCGHGLGRVFHDRPNILHYGEPGDGVVLEPGMLFTIEPMINLGKPHVKILRRRLDGGDARSRAVGAVRAHGGRHRDGLRDIHDLAGRPAQAAVQSRREPLASGAAREGRWTKGPGCQSRARPLCSRRPTRPARSQCGPSPAPQGALRQRRAGGAARLRAAGAGAVQRDPPARHQAGRQAADRTLRLVRRGDQRAARARSRGQGRGRRRGDAAEAHARAARCA